MDLGNKNAQCDAALHILNVGCKFKKDEIKNIPYKLHH